MRIDVVQLQIVKSHSIDINTKSEFVYGVETAAPIFIQEIGSSNIEQVALLCLNSTNRVINFSVISMGNIKTVKVSIPQMLKVALMSNASKLIVGHNHPSGILEMTSYDVELTRKIAALTTVFEIELIDSIVVNSTDAISIREESTKNNEG